MYAHDATIPKATQWKFNLIELIDITVFLSKLLTDEIMKHKWDLMKVHELSFDKLLWK